jgi:hypothetical protein
MIMLTQEQKVAQTIENYQQNFADVKLAYLFSLINQEKPELFVLSNVETTNKGDDLTQTLIQAKSFEKIEKNSNLSPDIKKLVKNMKYMSIDWDADGWQAVKTIININNLSPILTQEQKQEAIKNITEIQENFGLKELIIQSQQHPLELVQNLKQGLMDLCDTAEIKYNQFGLDRLTIHYGDENGDFTGYFQPGENFLVVKKLFVLAHEWMHFIDEAVGVHRFKEGIFLTDLMNNFSNTEKEDLWKTSILKPVNEFKNFLSIVNKENQEYDVTNFDNKIVDCAQFLHKYALNKDTFNNDVKKVAKEFSDKNSPNYLNHDYFDTSIKSLLDESHAPRYFSFLKAQAEVYEKNVNDIALKAPNAFVEFSQLADKHLGEANYTESTIEVFARTFETYIQNECEKKGIQSSLCVHHDAHFYPQKEDKQRIIEFWEKGFAQIKEQINSMCSARDNKLSNPSLESLKDNLDNYTINNLLNKVKENRPLTSTSSLSSKNETIDDINSNETKNDLLPTTKSKIQSLRNKKQTNLSHVNEQNVKHYKT